jgi:methylmalonyl-CoA mutase
MAAVLGGTQSLHTNSFDEAIALPTDFSARIARNTQLILAEESGITHVADPLGGSIRREPDQELADKAWALIEEVEALGGMTAAVREGLPKRRIEEASAERAGPGRPRRDGDRRRQPLPAGDEAPIDILEVDNDKVRAGQIARIERVRASATRRRCRAALDALHGRRERGEATCSPSRSKRRAPGHAWARSAALEEAFGPLRHHAGAGARHLRRRL